MGGCLLSLGFNMIVNFALSIPAWVLLICHFVLGTPLLWFWIALGAWVLLMVAPMAFVRVLEHFTPPSPPPPTPEEQAARDAEIRERSRNLYRNKG